MKITFDGRPLILFERFGFTHIGLVSLSLSAVSYSSSLTSPDISLFCFFLLPQDALLASSLSSSSSNHDAGEVGMPFFSCTTSEFVELFVGVRASRVRDLFEKAKSKSLCIMFIDVGRQRGAGLGGGNDERERSRPSTSC